MAIDFTYPLVLLFLLPAVGAVGYWWYNAKSVSRIRRSLIALCRVLVFALLILSLAGTWIRSPILDQTVVFVVDRSASLAGDDRAMGFLRQAVAGKQKGDRFAVVAVGAGAAVEQPLKADAEIHPLGTDISLHGTDIASGLRLASGLIPSEQRGRVVVLSDGKENRGDAISEARYLQQRGVRVDVAPVGREPGQEVAATGLHVPQRLYVNEKFAVIATVESTIPTAATLRLYENDRQILTREVALEKGTNRFSLDTEAKDTGFLHYRLEVDPAADSWSANNVAAAYSEVGGVPRVLVVEGQSGAAGSVIASLRAGGIQVEQRIPSTLPSFLEDYRRFAGIVLANVPATSVKEHTMEAMRAAVRDLGLGLVMTGGPDSFGLGGWFQTPIEEALPVHMDLRGKQQMPSLGLVLVIDKSGSMSSGDGGPSKMDLAKEAAIRSTEMLGPQDTVAIVGFDSYPWVVVEPTPVTDLKKIHRAIGGIFADGGTDIYPAVGTAYELLKKINTQRKHVILLTDGQSGRPSDYQPLLEKMKADNITVSTVAVGGDADTLLLEQMARWAGGRHYFTSDGDSIPTIFSKETALAGRTYIVDQPHRPRQVGGPDWSGTLGGALPILNAYIAVTPKQTAETVLTSPEPDPVLARWQYGLGRTVAWMSDAKGQWSADWAAWSNYGSFWSQVVGWTFPQYTQGPWQIETRIDRQWAIVQVKKTMGATQDIMPGILEATVINQKMRSSKLDLAAVGPGKYEGRFPATEPGSYLVQITAKEGEQVKASATHGVVVSYSPEYTITPPAQGYLVQLAFAGGGAVLREPAESFADNLPGNWAKQDISLVLLTLATLLWPVDVGLRRLRFSRETYLAWRHRLPGRHGQGTFERVQALERLQAKKKGKVSRYQVENSDSVRENPRTVRENPKGTEKLLRPSAEEDSQPVVQMQPQVFMKAKTGEESPQLPTETVKEDDSPIGRLLAAKRRTKN